MKFRYTKRWARGTSAPRYAVVDDATGEVLASDLTWTRAVAYLKRVVSSHSEACLERCDY